GGLAMTASVDARGARRAGAAALFAAVLAAGCASDAPKPTPLEPNPAKITGHQVWKSSFSNFGAQGIAVVGKTFVIGGRGGSVAAVDAESGREQWRVSVGDRLS